MTIRTKTQHRKTRKMYSHTPASPVARDESRLYGDGARRVDGHDSARMEDNADRSGDSAQQLKNKDDDFDMQELRYEQEAVALARRASAAPAKNDEQYTVDEADDLLNRELGNSNNL